MQKTSIESGAEVIPPIGQRTLLGPVDSGLFHSSRLGH
jgi:hypothetical protein